MSSLTLATLLYVPTMVAAGDDSYANAHREAEAGKPMVVMVSAEWCGPCQQMKKTVIPQIRKRGLLQKVAFAVVNVDRQQKLARKLLGGGAIPQLIMFRRTPEGWRRKKLVGGQSVNSVKEFISQGISLHEADQPPTDRDGNDRPPQADKAAAEAPRKAEIQPVSVH